MRRAARRARLLTERLYYAAMSTACCKKAFCMLASDLQERAPAAGEYLRYLTLRGQAWPRVA